MQNVPPASQDLPLERAAFAAAAATVIPANLGFAIAVSGGADSMALMCLAAEWCRSIGRPPPLVITVDHGLREASAVEAAQVARWAQAWDLEHLTLSWAGRDQPGNLQAEARRARYALMGEAMAARGISVLATGHTRDDQAETFLIRLARGSGLAGLSGMKKRAPFPVRGRSASLIVRPLLDVSHASLVATLRERSQPWIEDPSNANPRFLRARIRAATPHLEALGLTPPRLSATAAHLARANEAVDRAVRALAHDAVAFTPWGYALLQPQALSAAPAEVTLRLAARIIATVSGEPYTPRFEALSALVDWLGAPAPASGRTLGGCRVAARADGAVLVAREEAAMLRATHTLRLAPGGRGVWDGRFEVAIAPQAPEAEYDVKPLGLQGVRALGNRGRLPPHEPRRVAATCPAIWHAGRLVSAPNLGYDEGIGATAVFLQA